MQVIIHISDESLEELKNRVDEQNDEKAIMIAITFALDNY